MQELSDSVCSYEKLRVQDQMALGSLQEELEQLQLEKQDLVRKAASTENITDNKEQNKDENQNFRKIVDKVLKYKKLLLEAEDKEVSDLHEVFMLPDQEDFKDKCKQLEQKLETVTRERSSVSPGKLDDFIANSGRREKIESLQVNTDF